MSPARRLGGCLAAALAALALGLPAAPAAKAAGAAGLDRVQHIILIYLENHSFDNLFGEFPGADGLAEAGAAATQVDLEGRPYKTLPPAFDGHRKPPGPDPRFPPDLPNRPFLIDRYVPESAKTPDLVHRFYQEQEQIDGGRMDKFAAISDARGLSMGYYDGRKMRLWQLAREYTLFDHFFHAAFGGSFLNHIWTICACSPRYENAPAKIVAEVGPDGRMIKDGLVTPDGYAVNTIQSVFEPHAASITEKTRLLPPQTMPTIGDRLSAKNISWAWYSGGWNAAQEGRPDPSLVFQYHHQPFAYFANYGDGTPARREHLKDETDFLNAIDGGTLPAVVFYKPVGRENEHPGYANVTDGDAHLGAVVDKLRRSRYWASSVIIVTYDENGGYWDHVAPPKVDRWGPGSRVPAVLISPFARRHHIDHRVYDTSSVLKMIETRYRLAPLTTRDAHARDLADALDLSRTR